MAPSGGLAVAKPHVQPKSLFSHVRLEHLAAGVSGGVVSTLVLHPLDLIKIRFQVNEGVAEVASISTRPQYQGIMDAFRTISRNEGIRGLYQGVTPNVWGAGASWGLYFLFYSSFKTFMQQGIDSKILSASQHMLVATEAGVVTLVLTNPVWVAKTRLCLQYEGMSRNTPSAASNIYYRGMFDCLGKIYRTEGVRGLYRGFTPGLMGVSHGSLQFMAYEELKKMYNKHRNMPLDTKFSSAEYLCFAALSKIFAAVITYPYQVLRARLQDQHRNYTGLMHVITQTWNVEGWRGFYKGLFLGLIRVTPACCITFVVYENMIAFLMKKPMPPVLSSDPKPANSTEAIKDPAEVIKETTAEVKTEDTKER